eukprot:1007145-Rhodomonas_salina.2
MSNTTYSAPESKVDAELRMAHRSISRCFEGVESTMRWLLLDVYHGTCIITTSHGVFVRSTAFKSASTNLACRNRVSSRQRMGASGVLSQDHMVTVCSRGGHVSQDGTSRMVLHAAITSQAAPVTHVAWQSTSQSQGPSAGFMAQVSGLMLQSSGSGFRDHGSRFRDHC